MAMRRPTAPIVPRRRPAAAGAPAQRRYGRALRHALARAILLAAGATAHAAQGAAAAAGPGLAAAPAPAPTARPAAAPPLAVRDDLGRPVVLAAPARRIVSLAPHTTELIAAAGGLDRLAGLDTYSDFPAAVAALPRVGSGMQPDIERLLALHPDLVIVWDYADIPGRAPLADRLAPFGVPVFHSRPGRLDDIPDTLERLGALMATADVAVPAAAHLRRMLAGLVPPPAAAPLRVFYQLGARPLYTLNGQGIIGDALARCGARSIFDALPQAAPLVNIESVLLADPQAIVLGMSGAAADQARATWRRLAPTLPAVRDQHFVALDPDRMHRATPRMIEETRALCAALDRVRQTTPRSRNR